MSTKKARPARPKRESITNEGSLAGPILSHGVAVEMLGTQARLEKTARDCKRRSERRIKSAPPSQPPPASEEGK